MTDIDPITGIETPLGNEADVVPADLARMREQTRPLLVLAATDEADRNARYNDDVGQGQLVSTTSGAQVWRKDGDGNSWNTLYDYRQTWRGEWDTSDPELGQATSTYVAPTWADYDNNLEATRQGKSVVVPVTGLYDIRCSGGWRGHATGVRQAVVIINPSSDDTVSGDLPGGFQHAAAAVQGGAASSYDLNTVNLACPLRVLSAGARVFFAFRHNSGTTLVMYSNPSWTWASIARVG